MIVCFTEAAEIRDETRALPAVYKTGKASAAPETGLLYLWEGE